MPLADQKQLLKFYKETKEVKSVNYYVIPLLAHFHLPLIVLL